MSTCTRFNCFQSFTAFFLFLSLISCQKKSGIEGKSAVAVDQVSVINRLDGSQIDSAELSQRIAFLMGEAEVTGLAIAVFNEGKVAYQRAFGYANFEEKERLRVDHGFYAASFSKAVFGYVVARLVDEGQLDLDQPLQDYLDYPLYEIKTDREWRGFQDLKGDDRYQRITLRMCLSHRTGFQNWRWIPSPMDPENYGEKGQLKIYFEPGTSYFYSGEGLYLAQRVIEEVTGQGLEELAQSYVFQPLNMNYTSYLWHERFDDRFCLGHTADQKTVDKDFPDQVISAGSMETTLIDYSRFMAHVLQSYTDSSAAVKEMFRPNFAIRTEAQFGLGALRSSDENDDIALNYGLGWGLLQTPYGFGAFKEGHDAGFQHYSILFPESQMGVLILTNSDNGESIFKALLEHSIADRYTPWKWQNYIPYDQPSNQ
ncbi:serine hydrolase domain-containing protein [Reichenbachiella ulvae]|uniref:Beta-lactamase family protein n=1 Tax=Reichenbachiella ulvae TaxID=2980104 RepID=A0ABT3CTP9_9BACT|nr:serine hydrolase domain-containing protein [Reichenbachiella ulvae]MCV9386850.1 beta-lactamase family protein [Reichenbachiella ulvae]